jgi:spore coat protein U-like protein
MKKMILISVLALIATAAFAQTTDTASITLQGIVEKRVAITATGTGDYNNLDLTVDVTNAPVVTVNEYSNVREGYTVSLASANAGASGNADPSLNGQAGGETLTYTVTYDGAAVSFTSGSAQLTDATAKTAAGGDDKTLAISYAGASANLANDTYTDDLTFTITAK